MNLPNSQLPISTTPNSANAERSKRWLGIGIVVLVTLFSFYLALNPHWVERLGRWGYVGAFAITLVASATVFLPAPGIWVVVAMSPGFNPVLLGLAAGLGSAVGELSGYVAGASGRNLVPKEQAAHLERFTNLTKKYGAWGIFALAAIPLPVFDIVGIVAGALRVPIFFFLLAAAAGKSIQYILLILVGVGPLRWLQQWFA